MTETNSHWVFEGNNRYSKSKYTKEAAEREFKTLINCTNCSDCIDCTGCVDCSDCNGCRGCIGCNGCNGCKAFLHQPESLSTLRMGSRDDITYFYFYDGEIYVRCGCFWSALSGFEEKVKETHGDDEHGKAYKLEIEKVKRLWRQ